MKKEYKFKESTCIGYVLICNGEHTIEVKKEDSDKKLKELNNK